MTVRTFPSQFNRGNAEDGKSAVVKLEFDVAITFNGVQEVRRQLQERRERNKHSMD